jgi:type I restriction enzyme S subunit
MGVKRGYKQTEMGVIPQDWDVVLLDSVAKRGSGHTPDKAHPEYWGGRIKWVSLQDSDRLDRLYIYDTAAKITPAGIANSSAKMHPEGTVILSRDAGVGKSAILKDDMAVSQHFIAWMCKPALSNHFLYYWLQSSKSEFERIAMGNTIKTIGLPYFRQLIVPLPTKTEQEAIADALSDADALIESLEQLLTKKRQIKQGAMQELLTGRRRLPEFENKAGRKQTDAGVVPADWQLRPILSTVRIANGQVDPRVEPYRSMVLVAPDHIESSSGLLLKTETAGDQRAISGKYLFAKGDIIYSKIRPHLRKAILADFAGLCSADMYPLKPAADVSARFIFATLLGHQFSKYAEAVSARTGMPKINRSELAGFTIALPLTRAEQTAIANILSDMAAELTALEAKLTKARQLKQGMMQELLTGRIRLL